MYKRINKNSLLNFSKNCVSTLNHFKSKIEKLRSKLSSLINNSTCNIKKNSFLRRNKLEYVKFIPFSMMGLMAILEKEKIMNCYKASNKELDKIMNNLENQIKNLEFRHHGKLRRQPIKYF
jgi:hypothetical protein